ncbi:LamG-like jellyroll fold domain-containing protein [Nostoc sp.]|uniref:LamG-like jellyroll fold domain-containing protein n=1 Tax=Nostoc sp. TaxID=1180 RepID=UPI003FA610CD
MVHKFVSHSNAYRYNYASDQSWSLNTYHPQDIGKISFFANNANEITLNSSFKPAMNTWSHIAICRSTNVFTFYGNGVSAGVTTSGSSIRTTSSNMYIGQAPDSPSEKWIGKIDDFRITKRCLYTENFTPPGKLPTN